MKKRRASVDVPGAPAAIGPYSHAVMEGGLLFCSGQIPLDPGTNDLMDGSIGDETTRCLENLDAICHAAETSLRRTIKATIYTVELARIAEINSAYQRFFGEFLPARAGIGISALPKGARVEIEAIVAVS